MGKLEVEETTSESESHRQAMTSTVQANDTSQLADTMEKPDKLIERGVVFGGDEGGDLEAKVLNVDPGLSALTSSLASMTVECTVKTENLEPDLSKDMQEKMAQMGIQDDLPSAAETTSAPKPKCSEGQCSDAHCEIEGAEAEGEDSCGGSVLVPKGPPGLHCLGTDDYGRQYPGQYWDQQPQAVHLKAPTTHRSKRSADNMIQPAKGFKMPVENEETFDPSQFVPDLNGSSALPVPQSVEATITAASSSAVQDQLVEYLAPLVDGWMNELNMLKEMNNQNTEAAFYQSQSGPQDLGVGVPEAAASGCTSVYSAQPVSPYGAAGAGGAMSPAFPQTPSPARPSPASVPSPQSTFPSQQSTFQSPQSNFSSPQSTFSTYRTPIPSVDQTDCSSPLSAVSSVGSPGSDHSFQTVPSPAGSTCSQQSAAFPTDTTATNIQVPDLCNDLHAALQPDWQQIGTNKNYSWTELEEFLEEKQLKDKEYPNKPPKNTGAPTPAACQPNAKAKLKAKRLVPNKPPGPQSTEPVVTQVTKVAGVPGAVQVTVVNVPCPPGNRPLMPPMSSKERQVLQQYQTIAPRQTSTPPTTIILMPPVPTTHPETHISTQSCQTQPAPTQQAPATTSYSAPAAPTPNNSSTVTDPVEQQARESLIKSERVLSGVAREKLLHQDRDGDTIMHLAIAKKHPYMVTAFLRRCQRESLVSKVIDVTNHLGQTAIYLATVTNQPDVLRRLLDYSGDVNIQAHTVTASDERHYRCPLHFAARGGQAFYECLSVLLTAPNVQVNKRDSDGLTALHYAVRSHGTMDSQGQIMDSKPVVKQLVCNGASLNLGDGKSGKTPLMYAIEKRDLDFILFLFDLAGVGQLRDMLNTQTFDGNTCLHIATGLQRTPHFDCNQHLQLLRHLMHRGADTTVKNSAKQAPRDCISDKKNKQVFLDVLKGVQKSK